MKFDDALLKRVRNNDITLTTLNLSGNNLGAAGAQALALALERNGSLTTLNLGGNNLGAAGAQALALALERNRNLATLNLGGNNLGAAGAQALALPLERNCNLTSLYLGGNNLGAAGTQALARALERNCNLTSLYLGGNNLRAAGAQALALALERNRSLTSLNLGGNNLGAAGAQALALPLERNASLTTLYLGDNNLGAAGAQALALFLERNASLTSLDLRYNDLGDAGAQALAKALDRNISLTSLYLCNNKLDSAGAQALALSLERNASLTTLYLGDNNLGSAGAQALAKALERNGSLTSLNLGDNNLGSAGAQALVEALERNASLTTLYLGNNNLGSAGARALAKTLERNASLTSLDLRYNDLEDAGVSALAEALEQNRSLTSLNLGGNDLGSAGARALAKTLDRNASLTSLYLGSNKLGSAGAQALAKALNRNISLTSLYLGSNKLGSAGAQALAEALEQNRSLTSLYLGGNNLGDQGAVEFAKALERNHSLTSLYLGVNGLGDAGGQALAVALERNHSLTTLDLRFNDVSAIIVIQLTNFLERNRAYVNDLIVAICNKNVVDINQLLKAGANVNQATNEGITPLYVAAQNGNQTIVEFLLQAGANVNQATNAGITPLYMAVQNGYFEITKLLLAMGGTLENNIAAYQSYYSAISTLLSKGLYERVLNISKLFVDKVPEIEVIMTIAYYCCGDYQNAFACIEKLKIVTNNPNVCNIQGYIYMEQGGYETGLKFYQEALQLDKNFCWALYNICQVELYVKSEKADVLQKIETLPSPETFLSAEQQVYAYHVKGFIYHQCLEHEKALACFNEALKIDKNDIFTLAKKGFLLACQGEIKEGIAQLNAALAINSSYSGALARLGYLLALQDKIELADKQFEHSLEINPRHFETLLFKSFYFIKQQKIVEAKSYLDQVLSVSVNRVLLMAQHAPEAIRKEVVLYSLQFAVQQIITANNVNQNKDSPIWDLLVHHANLFCEIKVTEITSCLLPVKFSLEQLNILLSQASENSQIYIIVSDLLLKHIKEQQLQQQQNEAHFVSSSQLLRQQLARFIAPNRLEENKAIVREHLHNLLTKGQNVDNLRKLLEGCLEPPMFLSSYAPMFLSSYVPRRVLGATKEKFLLQQLNIKIKQIYTIIEQYKKLSDCKLICDSLSIIRGIYISYRDKLLTICKEPLSKIEKEHRLKTIYTLPYRLSFSGLYHSYLSEGPSLHLAPKAGETVINRGDSQYGSHIVRQYGGIHFKYHNAEQMPCYPAVEYMVGSLYNTLAGAFYGIAPTEIVKLHRPGYIQTPAYSQILIASQTVDGINLLDFLDRNLRHYPEYIEKFDLYSFSTMIITNLLLNPADGKADNYMICFIGDQLSSGDADNFRIKIVGIDSDMAFANPIVRRHRGARAGQHFVEVKNIFYFFPQMKEKIHPDLYNRLVNQPAELLLINFIKALQEKNQYYKQLKDSGLLTKQEWKSLQLPIRFPRQDSLLFIYRQLLAIQNYLNRNKSASHEDLSKYIYPEMFNYYQQIANEHEGSPDAILRSICTLYAAAAPSLEEASIVIKQRDKTLMSKIAVKTMREDVYLERTHSLSAAVQEFIEAIDFARINSVEIQRILLQDLQTLNCLEQLILRNCKGLDDNLFINLVKALPRLKVVYLVGCPNVTMAGIVAAFSTDSSRKIHIGLVGCAQIGVREYSAIVEHNIHLALLAKGDGHKYHGFPWAGNANAILHRILIEQLTLSIEQIRFLMAFKLDLNCINDSPSPFNGYRPLHIAVKTNNLIMLSRLIKLGANLEEVDQDSKETPFQKAVKYRLFMPCYILSQAKGFSLSEENMSQLRSLAAERIVVGLRAYQAKRDV